MISNRTSKRKLLFFIIFLSAFLFKYNYLLLRVFHIPSIFGLVFKNIIFLLCFYFFYPLLQKRRWRVISYIFLFIFTILFMANYWYAAYFGNYLSLRDMGKGANLLLVQEMFFRQIFQLHDLVFFLDLLLLIFLIPEKKRFYSHYSSYLNYSQKRKKGKKLIAIILLVFLFSAQFFFTNHILGGYTPYELYQLDSSAFVNVYGLSPLYLYEFIRERNFKKVDFSAEKEVQPPSILEKGELDSKGIGEEVNIFVIQVESLDSRVIGYEYNGRELTPFLNQLKEEGLL